MWLAGGNFFNRSFALIVVIHLIPARTAHLVAAVIDQWRLNCIIPHIVYVVTAVAMIIITLCYDPYMWYITIYCAIKAFIFYIYAYLDG